MEILPGLRPDGAVDVHVARRVARAWLAGGIVGLPTETVYGLSADAQDASAVARIYRVKGRPADHPLIVHVQGPQAIAGWSAGRNTAAELLAEAFWPGALTLVVRRSQRAGDGVTGGQDTVALRCPGHPVALACLRLLAEESGDVARGVAAPSANRFGRVSPTCAADVLAEVGAHLDPARDAVVDGGACRIGVESTIVDCTSDPPRVLRLGAISQEQVDRVLAGSRGVGGTSDPEPPAAGLRPEPRAPGTLESHYAPRARVVLREPGDLAAGAGALIAGASGRSAGLLATASVATPPGWTRLLAPASAQEYARGLYAALRRADELGIDLVVAVLPDQHAGSLAAAVRDRLARAAFPG